MTIFLKNFDWFRLPGPKYEKLIRKVIDVKISYHCLRSGRNEKIKFPMLFKENIFTENGGNNYRDNFIPQTLKIQAHSDVSKI